MEAVYYAARANLQRLLRQHPNWTRPQLGQATGMSVNWVDKWKKRLLNAPKDDEQVLCGLSRAPHHPRPLCHSLGVAVLICDPHHPQQNGFVERYHCTLNQECLLRYRPKTLDEVRQVTEAFATHYNWQRPHQGIACGNRPPRVAFLICPLCPRFPTSSTPMPGSPASTGSMWCDG